MPEEVSKNNQKTSIFNNNKAVIFIGIFSFLVTTIFFGTFIIITLKQTNAPTKVIVKKAEEMGPVVSLGNDIIVNIRSEEGFEHFLKTNIVLELDTGDKTGEEVSKRIPQIRDLVINILASKTKEKIIEKEGKDQVRSEIINNINQLMTNGMIRNIYFQDFIIQ